MMVPLSETMPGPTGQRISVGAFHEPDTDFRELYLLSPQAARVGHTLRLWVWMPCNHRATGCARRVRWSRNPGLLLPDLRSPSMVATRRASLWLSKVRTWGTTEFVAPVRRRQHKVCSQPPRLTQAILSRHSIGLPGMLANPYQ
jgi:hypothetical protein